MRKNIERCGQVSAYRDKKSIKISASFVGLGLLQVFGTVKIIFFKHIPGYILWLLKDEGIKRRMPSVAMCYIQFKLKNQQMITNGQNLNRSSTAKGKTCQI